MKNRPVVGVPTHLLRLHAITTRVGLPLMRGPLAALLALAALTGASAAAEGVRMDALALAQQAQQASDARQYPRAITLMRSALERQERADFRYDLACYLALSGDADHAFTELGSAIDEGYLDAPHLQQDTDLQSLHQDPRFPPLVDRIRTKAAALQARLAAIPPAKEVFEMPLADLGSRRFPLIVALHGVGDNPQHFATYLRAWARQSGFALLAISGSQARSDRGDAFGWAIPRDLDRVHRIVGDIIAHQPIDASRVYIVGFSQGAVMSYPVAFHDPQRFAGIIALSGALMPETIDAKGMAAAAPRLPIAAFHGEQDRNVVIGLDQATMERLRAAHFTVHLTTFTGGHQFPPDAPTQLTRAIAWIDQHRPAQTLP